ncbi:MAG: hypothetical protein M3296_02285, partial [Actinomycetota bacterium]|nr:hypothetical protein [Actinomycetota bacterium]
MRVLLAAILSTLFVLAAAPFADAQSGAYTACGAVGEAGVVGVSGASCEEARSVAAALVAAPPE